MVELLGFWVPVVGLLGDLLHFRHKGGGGCHSSAVAGGTRTGADVPFYIAGHLLTHSPLTAAVTSARLRREGRGGGCGTSTAGMYVGIWADGKVGVCVSI